MNRIRAAAIVGAMAVVALLGGCAAPSPGASTTATMSPAPTSTPTPTVASAPTVRVPLTCDQLVPPAVVGAAFRMPVHAVAADSVRNPAAFADARAGALRCIWAEGDPSQSINGKQLYGWVTVIPDVTREHFEEFRSGIDVGGMDEPLGTEPDTYSMCSKTSFQVCGFFTLTDGYAVQAGVWDYGAATYESQSAWVNTVSAAALPAVRALPGPAPLWQPAGSTLRGAHDCDQLIGGASLNAILGHEVVTIRSDGGEYALSTMSVNQQVGSYACTWSDQGSPAVTVSAAVLPGGASYADAARPTDAVAVPALGDSAYRTGTELDVLASHGWVQVNGYDSVDDTTLVAIARQVLANVGYSS